MPIHLKPREASAIVGAKLRGKATQRKQGMNGLERKYAAVLESRKLAGEIQRWDFEPVKLRLADRTFYTPDFRVVLNDATIEFHETKGGFMRDDAATFHRRNRFSADGLGGLTNSDLLRARAREALGKYETTPRTVSMGHFP
jgi:hypothetical protein